MFARFERLIIALVFALLAAGVTLVVAQAQTPVPPVATPAAENPPGSSYESCFACHEDINDSWKQGPHGQALSDPVFANAWNEQGQPGVCLVCHTTGYDPATGSSDAEGVTCEACHSPIPVNHPVDNMPVDKSPDLCGKCHSDPRFASNNWMLSAHYQRALTCSVCHNPHSAAMKTVQGTTTNAQDASALCENCHKDAMNNFPSSKHAEVGVTCVNCHLGFNVGNEDSTVNFAEVHKAPDHSFVPTLETCNKCHSTQMHAPGQSVAAAAIKIEEAGGTATPAPTPVVISTPPITNQPSTVSPVGYAGLAGLVGLAAGMVLAPWLERFYHRVSKHRHEDESHE
jgi:predicted CXXCH cytochrome family protein